MRKAWSYKATIVLGVWLCIGSPLIKSEAQFTPLTADESATASAITKLQNAETRTEGLLAIRKMPAERVIPQLAQAMKSNPAAFDDNSWRFTLYEYMHRRLVSMTPEGWKVLISGLHDKSPFIRLLCVKSLEICPQEYRHEVASTLCAMVDDSGIGITYTVLMDLGAFESVALPCLEKVKDKFLLQDNEDKIRKRAALSMVQIGGASEAINIFEGRNAEDTRIALEALWFYFMKKRDSYNPSKPVLQKMRAFFLTHLFHEQSEVRRQANMGLFTVAFNNYPIEDGKQFDLDADVVAAIEQVYQEDPDLELRDVANEFLKYFRKRAGLPYEE